MVGVTCSVHPVVWCWVLRGYALFLALFLLGARLRIVLNGIDGGLSEAGGTLSVLSGWLLWGMLMTPLVGVASLMVGVMAWLLLSRQRSVPVAALATGSVAALALAGIGVWFAGIGDLDLAGLLVVGALAGSGAAALTMRDARRLRESDPRAGTLQREHVRRAILAQCT